MFVRSTGVCLCVYRGRIKEIKTLHGKLQQHRRPESTAAASKGFDDHNFNVLTIDSVWQKKSLPELQAGKHQSLTHKITPET